MVTAQRRPERPEDVPISLTALSGEELERMQATDMAGLGKVVPSLVMTRTSVFTQPFLRGVGKRSNLGVENSVATYVDGVYLASSISALLDLRGIDRVEVLNGPQGTLFGRNATGGVIQVITRDPTSETSGEAELHAGTYGHVRGDAYLTGGNDRIAGNLAVSLSRNGGYGTNLYTGRTDQGEVDHSFVARSKWIWRPAPSLKLTLAGDYQDLDQDCPLLPVAGFPPIGQPRVQGFHDGDHDTPNRFRFRYGGVSLRADAEIGSLTLHEPERPAPDARALEPGPGHRAAAPVVGRPDRRAGAVQPGIPAAIERGLADPMGGGPLLYPHRRAVRPDHLPLWRQLFGAARRPDPADPVQQRKRIVLRRPTARGHCRSARRRS